MLFVHYVLKLFTHFGGAHFTALMGTPNSVLRSHSWQAWAWYGCKVLNPGQPCARQMTYWMCQTQVVDHSWYLLFWVLLKVANSYFFILSFCYSWYLTGEKQFLFHPFKFFSYSLIFIIYTPSSCFIQLF